MDPYRFDYMIPTGEWKTCEYDSAVIVADYISSYSLSPSIPCRVMVLHDDDAEYHTIMEHIA